METIGFFIVGGAVAGKASFIGVHTVKEIISSGGRYEERPNDPFFLSSGWLFVDDIALRLYGADPLVLARIHQELSEHRPDGFIALIDSTRTDKPTSTTAHESIQFIANTFPTVPLIVAAHKQDLPTAKSPAAVRELLQIPPTIPVMPSSIYQPRTIQAILLALLRLCPNEPKFQTALRELEQVWSESS